MTTINLIRKEELLTGNSVLVTTDKSIGEWIVENYYGSKVPYAVYEGIPSAETCITNEVDNLCNGYGTYTVLETPGEPTTIALAITAVLSVYAIYKVNNLEEFKAKGAGPSTDGSNNNALSARTNKARVLQRVPDIKGTVTSIPDVLYTYSKYINEVKIETGYYCIGRKQYKVDKDSVRDGIAPLIQDNRSSVQIYYPGQSPNDLIPPPEDQQIGEYFNDPVVAPYRSGQVSGQNLLPPGSSGLEPLYITNTGGMMAYGIGMVLYTSLSALPQNIAIGGGAGVTDDWLSPDYKDGATMVLENCTCYFYSEIGLGLETLEINMSNTVVITNRFYSGDGDYVFDIEGTPFPEPPVGYRKEGTVKVTTPLCSFRTTTGIPVPQWVYMNKTLFNSGFINIGAPNGIYRNNGGTSLLEYSIDIETEFQAIDEFDEDVGAVVVVPGNISNNNPNGIGIAIEYIFPSPTRFKARTTRITPRTVTTDQISDTLILEDLYGIVDLSDWVAGDVTTVQTRNTPITGQENIQNRELNLVATEMIDEYLGGGLFQSDLTPGDYLTPNASAIQSYIADFIDPKFGNRPLTEIDADGMLGVDGDIIAYFGNTFNNQFNYTIDNSKTTMQEYSQILFNAINSIAYRDGSLVKAYFEKPQDSPAMLFTHRSKIAGAETYQRNMNLNQLNDGVEFVWIDPVLNTPESIFIPEDRLAQNPKKIEQPGFRNLEQARVRAWREYNKLLNNKNAIQFTATADGVYVRPGDVISVVKGSRVYNFDGEVLEVSLSGYILTLSQDVTFTPSLDNFIILKDDNGDLETITVTAGTESNKVVLASLPSFTIRTSGTDYQRRTEFCFGTEDSNDRQWFIASSIDVSDRNQIVITGYNYSDKYYQMDNLLYENAFDDGFDDGFS